MARSTHCEWRLPLGLVSLLASVTACSDNTYVIGRVADAETDAARDDASAPDPCDDLPEALACASFEEADLVSGFDASIVQEGGALERTTERAHTGSGALHASSSGSESVAIVTKALDPVFSGELFLRLHLYVPSGLPTETMNIVFLGDVPQPDPFRGLDINLEDGALQVFSPQATPSRQTGSSPVPRDRWFCLLAHFDLDQGNAELRVDDALALEASGLGDFAMTGVRELRVGIDWSSEQADFFELYVDDIVLDDTEVGCE